MNYLLIVLNICLLVIGQTLWKIGVKDVTFNSIAGVLTLLLSPWIISGVLLYGLATVLWIYLLSKYPLSFLYPLQSLAYVIALLIAIFLFKEYVSMYKWFGVIFILIGVYFISK